MAYLFKKKHGFKYPVLKTIKQFIRQKIRSIKTGLNTESELKLTYLNVEDSDTLQSRLDFLYQPISDFDDFLEYMVCEGNVPALLRFEDRNSMAFSIESRVPFLINELMDFSLSISHDFKLRKGITKYILREAMRGITPSVILDRVDKLGFPAPDKKWMKEFYNLDVSGPFSDEWCDLILDEWRKMNISRRQFSLNLL